MPGKTLDEHTIQLIKSTWGVAITKKKNFAFRFYEILFEKNPEVRSLFGENMSEQADKVARMVTVVVTKLDKFDELLPEVRALAKRHIAYGATAMHFPAVGTALLATLEEFLEARWTPETQKAWKNVYSILSDAMIEAMSESQQR